MKRQIKLKSLTLACVFAALSFAIRRFNILVIPLAPPLVLDFRGVPAFIGSCLVPYYYAWFIGWAASEFDLILGFGTDFMGWIPACLVCSILYSLLKKRIKNRTIDSSISVIIGQTIGNIVFSIFYFILLFYGILSGAPFIFESFLIGLTARSILTFIATVPLLAATENVLKRLGYGEV